MGSWSPLGALWPCLGALWVPYDLPGCALGALWVPLAPLGRQAAPHGVIYCAIWSVTGHIWCHIDVPSATSARGLGDRECKRKKTIENLYPMVAKEVENERINKKSCQMAPKAC